MDDRHEPRIVNDILEACTTTVAQETPARWKFALRNGVEIDGVAHYDDDWLCLTAAPMGGAPGERDDGAFHLLTLNGLLPGGTKFFRLGDGAAFGILGELSLAPDVDLARRVREICEGFKFATEAQALVFDGPVPRPKPGDVESICGHLTADRVLAADDARQWDAAALVQLCAEAGWQGTERGNDCVVVELDVPGGGFRQAVLSGVGAADGLRVVTRLEACLATAANPSHLALGVLLLRTCGIVRMVRAAVDVTAERIVPRFEVCFDSAPVAIELARALAALSIACRVAADEAEAVQRDEQLAHIYMAALGIPTEPARGRRRRRGRRVKATTSRTSVQTEGSRTS